LDEKIECVSEICEGSTLSYKLLFVPPPNNINMISATAAIAAGEKKTCGMSGGITAAGHPCMQKVGLNKQTGLCGRHHADFMKAHDAVPPTVTVSGVSNMPVMSVTPTAVPPTVTVSGVSNMPVMSVTPTAVPPTVTVSGVSGMPAIPVTPATLPPMEAVSEVSGMHVIPVTPATLPPMEAVSEVSGMHVIPVTPAAVPPTAVPADNVCIGIYGSGTKKGMRCTAKAIHGPYCGLHVKKSGAAGGCNSSATSQVSGVSGMPAIPVTPPATLPPMEAVSEVSGMSAMPVTAAAMLVTAAAMPVTAAAMPVTPCRSIASMPASSAMQTSLGISNLSGQMNRMSVKDPAQYFQTGTIRGDWECIGTTIDDCGGCNYYTSNGLRCGKNVLTFVNILTGEVRRMNFCNYIPHSKQSADEKAARQAIGLCKANDAWQLIDGQLPA
jgi:hypothetical protein